MHLACADRHVAAMADPPVKLPPDDERTGTNAPLPPPFQVLGPADQGQKCKQCGKAKGASRIKRGIVTYVLHEVDCAPDYLAAHPDDDDGLGPM